MLADLNPLHHQLWMLFLRIIKNKVHLFLYQPLYTLEYEFIKQEISTWAPLKQLNVSIEDTFYLNEVYCRSNWITKFRISNYNGDPATFQINSIWKTYFV